MLAQYSERKLKDSVVLRLMKATEITTDATLARGVSCRMTVTMSDGRAFVSQVDYPKGSIEVPMTDAEIVAKFTSLASPIVGARRAAQIVERVGTLEKCGDVGELMRLTAKSKQPSARRSRRRT